jgi:hypothetical protein
LIVFLTLGLLGFNKNIFGQGIYKWVDEKGTVHFSDNPSSLIFDQQKRTAKGKWNTGIEEIRNGQSGRDGCRIKKDGHKNRVFAKVRW